MAVNTHYRNNLEAVMQVNKNYTDSEIKKSEERILSIVARNNVDFIDHTDEATYRFTAPANSKLLMLQSIAGNSNKIAPSTPSDDSVARLKVIPDNTYKSQIDYIGGKTVKYNQLVQEANKSKTYPANVNIHYDIQTNISCNANDKILLVWYQNTTLASDVRNTMFYNDSVQHYQSAGENYNLTSGFKSWIFQPTSNTFKIGYWTHTLSSKINISGIELINLTQKFGAGNEPSDVDTAIPLLKANGYKLDGTDTYSTGSLKHAIVSGVEYESKNLFDYGAFTTLGSNYYVEVIGGKTLYRDSEVGNITRWSVYDSNKNLIENMPSTFTASGTYTLPTNAKYINPNNDTPTSQMCIGYDISCRTYIPYVAPITKAIPSQVLADARYGLGFDNTNYNHLDIDEHLRGKYSTKTYSSSDVGVASSQTYTNIVYYAVAKPLDYKGYNNYQLIGNTVLSSKFEPLDTYSFDTTNNIGKIVIGHNLQFWFGFAVGTTLAQAQTAIDGLIIDYEMSNTFDQDYSQYFDTNWNKVDLNKQYATCEMVVADPIDMPNKVEYYGTIIHALATAVKQDGFNVWDEQKELGGYDQNTGAKTSSSITYRNVNPIAVRPNTEYYIKKKNGDAGFVYYYDGNMNYISASYRNTSSTFTTPSNCYFINFTSMASTWLNETCINISNQDLNGTYKPYKAPITRLLPNSEAKYSWGIADSVRNTRVFCDDEGNAVNEGQLDVGNQDLGTLTWNYASSIFSASKPSNSVLNTNDSVATNILCEKYTTVARDYVSNNDKSIAMKYEILIKDTAFTNATIFKNTMSGEMLKYEKATTDTETLDDFDYFFDCEEGDTFTLVNSENLQCYATYSFLIKEEKSNE